jgi:hypothetical protein
MANVLTDLAADIYKAADIVGRELVGAIPSSTINAGSERAAVGQTVRAHFTRAATVVNSTPSMTIPEGTDQTIDNKTLTLTKERAVQIPWTGEDVKFVNGGSGFETIYGDQIQQAMRALVNEVEVDLCTEIYKNASRSVGVEGTTPFASDFDLVADLRKILVDNGMPDDGQATIIMDTAAGANLRKLAQLQKVNEAGGSNLLRQGTLLDLQNLMIKESAGVQSHTAGTGTDYLLNGALAVGDTTVTVDTGSGTILAGDIVTIGNNDYVVATDLSGSTFTVNDPGIREVVADNATVTVGAARTANFAFHRAAAEVAFRAPALPNGGDAAVDRLTVQDPFSGLVFEIAAYAGYQKAMFNVGAVWGVKAWKDQFIASLAG